MRLADGGTLIQSLRAGSRESAVKLITIWHKAVQDMAYFKRSQIKYDTVREYCKHPEDDVRHMIFEREFWSSQQLGVEVAPTNFVGTMAALVEKWTLIIHNEIILAKEKDRKKES